jgi:protein-S-isoprenylcysteine O-methyltransferase Ste14
MQKRYGSIVDQRNINFFYQLTCHEIQHVKKQQWAITCYCIVLNILLLGVFKLLENNNLTFYEPAVLVILSVCITIIGIIYIFFTQNDLIKFNMRMRRIHKNLPDDKYLILEKPSLKFTNFSYHVFTVIIPFIIIIILSTVIVSYIILKNIFR